MTLGSHDWSRWYPIVDEKLRARGIDPSAEPPIISADAIVRPTRRVRHGAVAIVMAVLVIGIAVIRFMLP